MRRRHRLRPDLRIAAALALLGLAGVLAPFAAAQPTAAADDPLPSRAGAHFLRTPPRIDGNLDDWNLALLARDQLAIRSERQVNRYPRQKLSQRWSGPDDLSATLFLAYDARALYLAGRVKDDVLLHRNNITWWLGDAIELFLDTDAVDRAPERGAPSPYNEDDYQIFLLPLNPEVLWGIHKPKPGETGFTGVRVACTRLPDGYDFEAAFPWHNFSGMIARPGLEIGFDLALDDLDDPSDTETETYMVWNGQLGPSESPDRFGTLVLLPPGETENDDGSPMAADADKSLLDLLVIVILVSGLVASPFAANVLLRRVSSRPMQRKLAAFAVVATLLAIVWALPLVLRTALEATKRHDFESRLVPVSAIVEEVRSSDLLDVSSDSFRDDLERLLRGDEVAYEESYSFRTVPLAPPAPVLWTEQGIPFDDAERGVLVADPGRNAFLVGSDAGGTVAETVYVVYSVEPHDGWHAPPVEKPQRDSRVGAFRLVFANQRTLLVPLETDVNADYGIQPSTYTHPPTWSAKAPIARMSPLASPPWPATADDSRRKKWIEHSHQLALDVPAEMANVGIVAIEYVHESPRDAVRILGLATSNARRNPQLEPVPFVQPSRTGVPIRIFHDSPRSATVVPEKGNERGTVIPINARADRIWFVYSATNTFPLAPAASKFDTIGAITVTTRGENVAQHEIPLVVGENVDDRRALVDGRHAPGMKSRVAEAWTDADGTLVHQDILEYAPAHPGEITEVAIRDTGGGSTIRLSAVTLGTVNPGRRKALADLATIAPLESGRAALTTEARSALRDLEIAVVKEKLLAELAGPGTNIRWRDRGDRRALTAFLPVDPNRAPATFLEVSDRAAGKSPSEAPFTAGKVILLAILLPLGLVLVTDFLDRSPRLRVKLVVTFAIASVLPLVVFFFALSRTVGRHVEESLALKLESHRLDAQATLDLARKRAQSDAETLLRDARIVEMLSRDADLSSIETRLTELRRERIADQPSSYVILRDHRKPPDRQRFAETLYRSEAPATGFVGLVAASTARRSDVVAAGGTLLVLGFASTEGRTSNRYQDLVVAVPLEEESLRGLQRGLKGAELSLLAPRGETFATTLSPPPAATPDRIREDGESIRQSLASGTPPPRVVEYPGGPYLVAYDRIRDADGRTVAAMSVAVPRTDLSELQDQLKRWFAILGSVVFLLVIVVGSLMTAKITVPVERLERVTAEIASGNLQCEVPEGGADEVGSLTRAFNAMTADLRRRIQQLHELNRGIQALNETLDPSAIVGAAADALQRASGADGVVLVRRDPSRESLQVLGGIDRGTAIRPFSLPNAPGLVSDALQRGEPFVVAGLRRSERYRKADPDEQRLLKPYGAVLGLPLVAGGETRGGALLLYRSEEIGQETGSREFLNTLASQVTIALENARLYQLAVRDPVSGLHVHSYFAGRLKEEIDRAQRSKSPLSIIRVDVDGFRPHRDAIGQDPASETLRDVARTIRSTLRRMYVAARTGEASFEILLPETEKREALRVADRLRRQVETRLRPPDVRSVAPLAAAIGVASFPEDASSVEFLLNAVERALEKSRAAARLAPPSAHAPAGTNAFRAPDVLPPRTARGASAFRAPTDLPWKSEKSLAMLETANRYSRSSVTVLIQGETGVGKEVLAEYIHTSSPRHDRLLVKVNATAIPETLLESELFGHEKGAFTGADQRKIGRFEQADGGTLFLDEIGDLSPSIQVKLLRVLQDRTFERLGSSIPLTVNVRIIAATNRNLVRAIQTGTFREDLYYRLNVAPITVPPLRERKEEIPGLVDYFITRWNVGNPSPIRGIAPEALDLLFHHSWPGNVRELKNCVERAMAVSTGSVIRPDDVHIGSRAAIDAPAATAPAAPEHGTGSVAMEPLGDALPRSVLPAALGIEENLNPRQREVIQLLESRPGPGITTAEYVELVRVSERTGLRDLADLVRRRILRRVGRTRGAVYRLESSGKTT